MINSKRLKNSNNKKETPPPLPIIFFVPLLKVASPRFLLKGQWKGVSRELQTTGVTMFVQWGSTIVMMQMMMRMMMRVMMRMIMRMMRLMMMMMMISSSSSPLHLAYQDVFNVTRDSFSLHNLAMGDRHHHHHHHQHHHHHHHHHQDVHIVTRGSVVVHKVPKPCNRGGDESQWGFSGTRREGFQHHIDHIIFMATLIIILIILW